MQSSSGFSFTPATPAAVGAFNDSDLTAEQTGASQQHHA